VYKVRKAFGIRKNSGKKVFIKFHDDETVVGFIEGGTGTRGFLTPVD
jgi:hypothetical protein